MTVKLKPWKLVTLFLLIICLLGLTFAFLRLPKALFIGDYHYVENMFPTREKISLQLLFFSHGYRLNFVIPTYAEITNAERLAELVAGQGKEARLLLFSPVLTLALAATDVELETYSAVTIGIGQPNKVHFDYLLQPPPSEMVWLEIADQAQTLPVAILFGQNSRTLAEEMSQRFKTQNPLLFEQSEVPSPTQVESELQQMSQAGVIRVLVVEGKHLELYTQHPLARGLSFTVEGLYRKAIAPEQLERWLVDDFEGSLGAVLKTLRKNIVTLQLPLQRAWKQFR